MLNSGPPPPINPSSPSSDVTPFPFAGGVDPCTLSLNLGMGQASLPRWYFDAASRTCKQFLYRGLKGNANNFVTREICAAKCPGRKTSSLGLGKAGRFEVSLNPCPRGEPAVDQSGNRATCSQYNTEACPVGYWCHFGLDAQTTACCPPSWPFLRPLYILV